MTEPVRLVPRESGWLSTAAKELRGLADRIDAGEILNVVAAVEDSDNWSFVWGANYRDAIFLADIAHARAIDRLKDAWF